VRFSGERSLAPRELAPAGTAEPLAVPYDREASVVLGGTAEFAGSGSYRGNGGLVSGVPAGT